MHYIIELETAEDADGEEVDYFRLELDESGPEDWPWYRGEVFARPPVPPIVLRVDLDDDEAGATADYLNEPLPLFSARLREAVEAVGVSNVQWFDATVCNADDWDGAVRYFACNVVGLVAAADPVRTKSSRPLGVMGADEIDHLVPDESRFAGLKIFRMAEHRSTLVVSQEIKDSVERHGITSLRFVPLEGWAS